MPSGSYIRVIPRDLFNEASLLKCLGRLWIWLDSNRGHRARFVEEAVDRFDVRQCEADGSLTVVNLSFTVAGHEYPLRRPLNSREPFPLYIEDREGDEISVFTDDGDLSPDFKAFIGWEHG